MLKVTNSGRIETQTQIFLNPALGSIATFMLSIFYKLYTRLWYKKDYLDYGVTKLFIKIRLSQTMILVCNLMGGRKKQTISSK